LQKHVESPLSVNLLEGQYSEGDTITVDVDEETQKLVFLPVGEVIPAEIDQIQAENQ